MSEDKGGILDGLTTIDDKLRGVRSDFSDLLNVQKDIRELLSSMPVGTQNDAHARGGPKTLGEMADAESNQLLMWPDSDKPRANVKSIDPTSYYGTFLPGVNTFDFEKGTVSLGNGAREMEMSQALKDLDADKVRSFIVHADNHIQWYAPEMRSGSFLNQLRADEVRDVEITRLQVQAFEPTNAVLFAGTSPTPPVDRQGAQRSFERVSYDTDNDSVNVTISDSWTGPIDFTTEYEAIRENTQVSDEIHTMNINDLGVNIDNNIDAKVEVAAEAKQTILHGFGPHRNTDYGEITGWERSNPVKVSASSSDSDGRATEVLEMGTPHHFIRFYARIDPSSGVTSGEIAISATGMST